MQSKGDSSLTEISERVFSPYFYKKAFDFAIDTMRKYEKIQEIVKNADTSSTIKSSLVFSEIKKVVEDGND